MAGAAIHHVAFACRDLVETHRFHADVLGLRRVDTEVQRLGESEVRDVFHDTGDVRATREEQDAAPERLEAHGIDVEMELDHGWCDSIHCADPNGILVALCCDRPVGMPVNEAEAERLLTAND